MAACAIRYRCRAAATAVAAHRYRSAQRSRLLKAYNLTKHRSHIRVKRVIARHGLAEPSTGGSARLREPGRRTAWRVPRPAKRLSMAARAGIVHTSKIDAGRSGGLLKIADVLRQFLIFGVILRAHRLPGQLPADSLNQIGGCARVSTTPSRLNRSGRKPASWAATACCSKVIPAPSAPLHRLALEGDGPYARGASKALSSPP